LILMTPADLRKCPMKGGRPHLFSMSLKPYYIPNRDYLAGAVERAQAP